MRAITKKMIAYLSMTYHFGFNILFHNAKKEAFIHSVRGSLSRWS
jgi:hypothetical protein